MPARECSRTREVLRKRDAWSKASCLRGSPQGDVAIHHAALKRGLLSLPSGRWCACGEGHAHGYMTHSPPPDFVVDRAPPRVRAAHVLIACCATTCGRHTHHTQRARERSRDMSRSDRGRDPYTTHPAQGSVPPLRTFVGTARQPTEACLAVTERAYMPPHEVVLGVVKAQQTADGLSPDLRRFPTPYGRSAVCLSEHVCRQRPTLGIPHHRRVPYCGTWPRCDGLATIHASMPYVPPWADMSSLAAHMARGIALAC
jgi:hypothetical protein